MATFPRAEDAARLISWTPELSANYGFSLEDRSRLALLRTCQQSAGHGPRAADTVSRALVICGEVCGATGGSIASKRRRWPTGPDAQLLQILAG